MGTEKTSWEEAKADILGLFMVTKLIEMGEITNITAEDAIATYIAGILRSVRFGAASSHGKANMMCFNYMEKAGAFSRDAKGQYVIDFGKAKEAMNGWAALILQTQGDGNVEFATKYEPKTVESLLHFRQTSTKSMVQAYRVILHLFREQIFFLGETKIINKQIIEKVYQTDNDTLSYRP